MYKTKKYAETIPMDIQVKVLNKQYLETRIKELKEVKT
jgi:hypothetical protein